MVHTFLFIILFLQLKNHRMLPKVKELASTVQVQGLISLFFCICSDFAKTNIQIIASLIYEFVHWLLTWLRIFFYKCCGG